VPGPKWILRGGGGGRVNLKEMTLDILLETVGQFPISSRKKCFTSDQPQNCAGPVTKRYPCRALLWIFDSKWRLERMFKYVAF
jgi:hypothetical protein